MKEIDVKIGILGTGNLAVALGKAWATAGHSIVLTGRSTDRVKASAEQVGATAAPVDPGRFAEQADVVVVAIAWDGLEQALRLVGGPEGKLAGKTVIDCTNPVDYPTGSLRMENGSAAEFVAGVAAGAHVVKRCICSPAPRGRSSARQGPRRSSRSVATTPMRSAWPAR
jgi:8-hydroxy-5-deazaflavin:NADPH oxidoreductase